MVIFITSTGSGTWDEDPGGFAVKVIFNGEASIFTAQYYINTPKPIENQEFLGGNRIDVVEITYLLQVKNDGEIKLHDVVLTDTLPQRMLYNASWYYEDPKDLDGPDPVAYLNPEVVPNDDGTTNRIQWKLGEFDTGQEKLIILKVRHSAAEPHQIADKYKENAIESSAAVESSEPVRYTSDQAQGLRQSEIKRWATET